MPIHLILYFINFNEEQLSPICWDTIPENPLNVLQLADLISICHCKYAAQFIVNEKYELPSKGINCLYLILKIINKISQSFCFKHIIPWNSGWGEVL